MLYPLLFPLVRIVFRLLLYCLPPEGFNRACAFLPGRLIIEGLRYYGASVGQEVVFTPPLVFHNFSDKTKKTAFGNLHIGNNCYFGRNLFLDLKGGIYISNNVTLAMGVMIVTHTDAAASPLGAEIMPSSVGDVTIQDGSYIGARATILQGVIIGSCAIVAAASLVKYPIPEKTVYAGVPAREIRKLSLGGSCL